MFKKLLDSWHLPLACAVLALFSLALIKGYTAITNHIEAVQQLKLDNKKLTEDNGVLVDNEKGLTSALEQAEQQTKALKDEMDRREKERVLNAQLQVETEERIKQQQEETRNAITAITEEIKRAGLRNLRLPDNVVRLLREKANAVNASAKGSGGDEGSQPAKTGSETVSGVPGS